MVVLRGDRRRLLTSAPRLLLVVAALALFAAGCGSSSHSTTQAASASDQTGNDVHIVMAHLDFSPQAVSARVGQRVVWTNEDNAPHNVTYVSGPVFKSSRRVMRPGTKFSIRLTQAGTIHYYCTIHPWMRATISVSQ